MPVVHVQIRVCPGARTALHGFCLLQRTDLQYGSICPSVLLHPRDVRLACRRPCDSYAAFAARIGQMPRAALRILYVTVASR